jgi:hypothetical protein
MSIRGAWYFDAIGARFLPHSAAFHKDGILHVTFPDAAEADRSAGMGIGIWERVSSNEYRLKFIENNAVRATNLPETTLVVEGTVSVNGDKFEGPATATYYDMQGNLTEGPYPAILKGQRITFDSHPPVMEV